MRSFSLPIYPIARNPQNDWLAAPDPGHFVQFYRSETKLFSSLEKYIGTGLREGDTCIVIATKDHLKTLNRRLAARGVDASLARRNGQYMTFDASETLASFMVDGLPDLKRFTNTVGPVLQKAIKRGKPICVFGEMVALLWKSGNKDAVIQLEDLWNKLADDSTFSLFCAYPELHFIMDNTSLHEIEHQHDVNNRNSGHEPLRLATFP